MKIPELIISSTEFYTNLMKHENYNKETGELVASPSAPGDQVVEDATLSPQDEPETAEVERDDESIGDAHVSENEIEPAAPDREDPMKISYVLSD